jgi:hypothetical protein
MKNFHRVGLLALAVLTSAAPAGALDLLVSQGKGTDVNDAHYYYGGSRWQELTAELDGAFDAVTVAPNLENLSQLLAHDRLWLDQRWVPPVLLSATELANIQAFLATGRRAVMIGENNAWTTWNQQILGLVGGSYAGEAPRDIVTPLPVHPELTQGVGPISFVQNSHGTAAGGTQLFTQNWATLWGNQVVTVLDVSPFEPSTPATSVEFRQNVVNWLAAVPEPSCCTMGLIGLVWWVRMRSHEQFIN